MESGLIVAVATAVLSVVLAFIALFDEKQKSG